MTVHIAKAVTLPDALNGLTNLADACIGASIVSCSDEFFAKAERMLQAEPAQFIEGKYDEVQCLYSFSTIGCGRQMCLPALDCRIHLSSNSS